MTDKALASGAKARAMQKIDEEDAPALHRLLRDRKPEQLEMSTRSYFRYRGGSLPETFAWLLNRPEIAHALARDAERLAALGRKVPERSDADK